LKGPCSEDSDVRLLFAESVVHVYGENQAFLRW